MTRLTRRAFLTAEWRALVIANFEVDPIRLTPLIPVGTELDLFEGRALVSLVGFRFLHTRLRGIPIPGHRDFDEVNLRFYVRRRASDGSWRRAVSFVGELVPRCAIALLARRCYNEPYRAVPMRHRLEPDSSAGSALSLRSAEYSWKLGGRWHTLGATALGSAETPSPESEAHFTIEHYWGYTRQRDGSTKEYEVSHPPWRVWRTSEVTLELDPGLIYGRDWSDLLRAPPTMVLIAEGSPVTVFLGARIRH